MKPITHKVIQYCVTEGGAAMPLIIKEEEGEDDEKI